MKSKKLKPFFWCFLLTIVFSLVRVNDPYPVEVLRLKGLDYYQRQQELKVSDNISIIEIDELSLEKHGQWPWGRNIIAEGIVKAYNSGAALVVLPILFAEEDRLGNDSIFVHTLLSFPTVTSQSASRQGKGVIVPRGVATIGDGLYDWLFDYPAGIGPVKEIGEASAGVGMLLTAPELDGVVRRLPLIIQVDGKPYPTLPLEVLRLFGGEQSYQVKVDEAGVNAIRVLNVNTISTDENARVWINFKYKFDKISYSQHDWSSVEGKIAVIALTAEGLSNSVATPINISNGHELNMQALQMIIDDNTLLRPVEALLYEVAAAALICFVLIFCALNLYYLINALLIAGVVVGLPALGFYLFNSHGLLFDYTYPVYASFIIFTIAIFSRFVYEFKAKMLIKKQFEHYLAPEIVKKLQRNPDLLKLGGDTQDLTILFSDIRGFTTISEQFKDNPQGLTNLINRYLTPMTHIVMESGGTIDKYIGDALMAFWNAPIPEDNTSHRIRAIEAAIKMHLGLEDLNVELIKENKAALKIGIGINTGNVVVGNMGSEQRFDYTCLGDAVNLAARLEGQTKAYGVGILLGQETVKFIEDKFKFIELDKIAVKGKKEGIAVYTLTNITFNYVGHRLFLKYYKGREWVQAKRAVTALLKENTPLRDYYKMMAERINELENNDPGEGWDHVYRAKTK
jgi:adenylate cyclase